MKRVLILGAGLVVKPMVEYLLESGFGILIASPMRERADEMINGHPNGKSVNWSMDDPATLDIMVGEHDLTVSLLPYKFHVDVARICLKHRKPLVTTSYVQPAMQELHNEALAAGVILLNEIGLDPGIDHMSAMRIIDYVHGKGGTIEEFYSICGALPAPEAAGNPMGYKFSWSPKGVVLASRNNALYLKDGKRVYIEPVNLFKDRFEMDFPGVGRLEVYPNRDSISYTDIYGVTSTKTMYRGTFRFPGWCETLDLMKELNMLDDEIIDYTGMSWSDFTAERAETGNRNLRKTLAKKMGLPADSRALESFEWLGLFSNKQMGYTKTSPFEITSDRMISMMMLGDNDRDMVVLQHVFVARYKDGTAEVIKSGMVDYGTPATNTSIARTVALPAAIAVKMILDKKITLSGVYRPVVSEIYEPVLNELETLGIAMKEEFGLPLSAKI
jgi:saccharopine dehydrogenase (NADP+, L-glutamate forming)